jgi:hypothetical protein
MRSLLLLLLFSYFTGGAQSYTINKITDFRNGEPSSMNGVPADLFMSTFTFSNSSNSTIYVFIDRYKKDIAPYWALCYCYIQCHSPAEDTVTVIIQPYSTTDITLQFKTDSVNPGISHASFRIYQKGFPANTQTVNLTASTLGPVALNENTENDLGIFPTFGEGTFNLRSGHHPICSVIIHDLGGRPVNIKPEINSREAKINLEGVTDGTYVAVIATTNGARLMKKIIKITR